MVLSVVVALAVLAGCAQSGYDAAKIRRELQRAGASPEHARCVTDALEANFNKTELGLHVGVTAQEVDTVRALLKKCGVPTTPTT
ncbi:MAG TPA: hypothetical protein VFR41_00410 [Acidimicrobiia bacterium]|nr:hypothetical protein [Acidimicrobiia bacterium]